jgi:hypothetical protein
MLYLDKKELSIPADMRGLLDRPDVPSPVCAVCLGTWDNDHHVIFKGAGGMSGELERRVPRIHLCGFGNASGCHGLAHSRRLHFDWRDGWEYLITEEPVKRHIALDMPGWERLPGWTLVERGGFD